MAFLAVMSWTFSASGQTAITVTGATTVYEPAYSGPNSLFRDALSPVTDRIILTYANALEEYVLPGMNPALQAKLEEVTDRIKLTYAGGNRNFTLAYPQDLINDQEPPALEEPIIPFIDSPSSVSLTWGAGEFVTSTLAYGTERGVYTQNITISRYHTETNVIVPNLTPGVTYYARINMVDVSGNQGQSPEFTFATTPRTGKPLVLVYAVLDNNLGDDTDGWLRLIRNVERGTNNNIVVRLMIDSPGDNNAYVYELKPNASPCITLANPTCGGLYVENSSFWRVDEDTAHPLALYQFVSDAMKAHNEASKVVLSLVGHGSGWTAGVIPSQPSSWGDQPSRTGANQERVGGLLWDDTVGGSAGTRSLSTSALAVVFDWVVRETGRTVDLLYLDACSMGMAEVGFELAGNVSYLLASPNTAWASFPYEQLLKSVTADASAQEIGLAWLQVEQQALDARAPSYPYTLALYDLSRMKILATQVSTFVTAMNAALPNQQNAVNQALAALARYESDYDGNILTGSDSYGDLWSFLAQLQPLVSGDQTLTAAISAVQTAIDDAIVGQAVFGEGTPYLYPDQEWRWPDAHGLSVYFPRGNEAKRELYQADSLRWVQDSNWRQFLDAVQPASAAEAAAPPTCASTRECTSLPKQLPVEENAKLFLPFVKR